MTKTFKIGEYAVGGTIRVSIPKTFTTIKIDIIDSNYNTKKLINQMIYFRAAEWNTSVFRKEGKEDVYTVSKNKMFWFSFCLLF